MASGHPDQSRVAHLQIFVAILLVMMFFYPEVDKMGVHIMRIRIAAVVVALLGSAANVAVASDQTTDWSGAFVGLHGGYGWGSIHDVNNPAAVEQDIDGGFGGVQIGYNHQFSSNIVLGVEADASFGDIGNSYDGRDKSQYNSYYTEDKVEAFGTLRARLGYAAYGFLPYVTGGLAWGSSEHMLGCDRARVALTNGCAANGGEIETTKSDTSVGWVIGGGLEYAFTDSWSIRGEYLFHDLGKNEVTLRDPNYPASISDRKFDTHFSTVRVGVNYLF